MKNSRIDYEIAESPDKLPPIREGFIRLNHRCLNRGAEHIRTEGLVYQYSEEHKKNNPYTTGHSNITQTTNAWSEDGFWDNLQGVGHTYPGDVNVIFDMPIEEYAMHTRGDYNYSTDGAKVDAGYVVGIISNYGCSGCDLPFLTADETSKMRKSSNNNPLPPFYESNWKNDEKILAIKIEEENSKITSERGFGFEKPTTNDNRETDNFGEWLDLGEEWDEIISPRVDIAERVSKAKARLKHEKKVPLIDDIKRNEIDFTKVKYTHSKLNNK